MTFLLWTLIPAMLLAISNILQKIGLDTVAHKVHTHRPWEWIKTVVRNYPWWGGIGIAAVATVGYYAAIGKYNISLVQPMMALNPVLTALAGWLFLKEHLDRRTAVAIGLVVIGLCFAGFLHGEARGSESATMLWVFSASCLVFVGAVRFFIHSEEVRKSLIGGVGFGLSAVLMKSLETHYLAAGSLGNALVDLPTLARALGYVATYLLGFVYLQVALTFGRALFVIPLTSAIGMLIPSIAGIVVFQEPFGWAKLTALGLVGFGSAMFVRFRD
jgi:uncharacterized membrane protein